MNCFLYSSKAGQNFIINSPDGIVNGQGQAVISSVEDGKATVSFNFGVTLNGIPISGGCGCESKGGNTVTGGGAGNTGGGAGNSGAGAG